MSASFNPSQWMQRTDSRTQRTYYVNRRTGRSTWDPVHRTAVDTEPVAAALYHAVVPVDDVTVRAGVLAPLPESKSKNIAPQVVSVPSSLPHAGTASSTSASSGVGTSSGDGARPKNATQHSREAEAAEEGDEHPTSESERSALGDTSAASTSATQGPTAPSIQVPLCSSASLNDMADVRAATPLGTSPIQPTRSSQRASAPPPSSAAASPPAPDALTRSPEEATASTLPTAAPSAAAADSPLGRGVTLTTDSSASLSSTQTQRPGDRPASPADATATSSTSRPAQQTQPPQQLPPPLPLPSLVSPPPSASRAAHGLGGDEGGASGTGVRGGGMKNASLSTNVLSSSSQLPSDPSPQQQQQQAEDAPDFDQEAAAAEEWRLTQRTWELEGERARLESELAVLRGPVEVETQSIAEDHERLLEAQRALDIAATLAVTHQQGKRAELDVLRQRLRDLQEQRDSSTFLLSTLQRRLAVLTERRGLVESEERTLQRQRKEMEEVVLPSAETMLHATQQRLSARRNHAAAEREQLEDRKRTLARERDIVQRLRSRIEEVTALLDIPTTAVNATISGASTPNAHKENRERSATSPLSSVVSSTAPKRRAADALSTRGELQATSPNESGKQLQKRIGDLQREVAATQSAAQTLYAREVLAVQQRALRQHTQQLCGETEMWQPVISEAIAMLHELQAFSKTQACKYTPLLSVRGGR